MVKCLSFFDQRFYIDSIFNHFLLSFVIKLDDWLDELIHIRVLHLQVKAHWTFIFLEKHFSFSELFFVIACYLSSALEFSGELFQSIPKFPALNIFIQNSTFVDFQISSSQRFRLFIANIFELKPFQVELIL